MPTYLPAGVATGWWGRSLRAGCPRRSQSAAGPAVSPASNTHTDGQTDRETNGQEKKNTNKNDAPTRGGTAEKGQKQSTIRFTSLPGEMVIFWSLKLEYWDLVPSASAAGGATESPAIITLHTERNKECPT
jgi:hypothetical protein